MSIQVKPPGVLVDASIWSAYLRLGFSKFISLDQNGGRHRYARTMVYLPDPSRRAVPIALARLFVVIQARQSLTPMASKGWTVRYKNGDHLDLRIENLLVVKARKQRNSFYASWSVNARWDIADAKGDPKAVLAARRRHFRATHIAAIKRGPQAPLPPCPRPPKKPRGGKS